MCYCCEEKLLHNITYHIISEICIALHYKRPPRVHNNVNASRIEDSKRHNGSRAMLKPQRIKIALIKCGTRGLKNRFLRKCFFTFSGFLGSLEFPGFGVSAYKAKTRHIRLKNNVLYTILPVTSFSINSSKTHDQNMKLNRAYNLVFCNLNCITNKKLKKQNLNF